MFADLTRGSEDKVRMMNDIKEEKMGYRVISANEDPRHEHFEYFMSMADPFVSLTVQLDITDWFADIRQKGNPFFLSFLYEIGAAANSVPELRRRIRNGQIIEFDCCESSYTVAAENGTYRYCDVRTDLPFEEYLSIAREKQASAAREEHLVENGDPDAKFYISCLPKLSYSSLQMTKTSPEFSVPCITWGKYYEEMQVAFADGVPVPNPRKKLPLTIMVNHALVDGLHLTAFFEALEARLKKIV